MGKMKANRKFIEGNERAVSAVIGVILMVAITVAIAATVYVYVSGMLGGTQNKAPNMAFNKQTTPTKGLTLVSADSNLKWSDFTITNGAITGSPADVTAGQFISFTGTATAYNITIVYEPTNTLMGTWAFP
jgi:archaeal type IV pilus assembly protein PilA